MVCMLYITQVTCNSVCGRKSKPTYVPPPMAWYSTPTPKSLGLNTTPKTSTLSDPVQVP